VFSYSVFGMRLDCDFPVPELTETVTGDPTWRVETRLTTAPDLGTPAIGSEQVQGDVMARAYTADGVLRLEFDDTGTFDVRGAARSIVWHPGPAASHAAVRADLLGRVLALAAHADGRLALHASAVSIDGQAVAFLGAKHAGKSTTALALVHAGARLLTDDTLIATLDVTGTAWAAVGVQRPRLWRDSARALCVPATSGGNKPTLDPLPPDQLERGDVPLRACYILNPVIPSAEVVRRDRLPAVRAALSLVQFAKLGSLLGGAEAPVVLDRAGALAERVPVYVADVTRDLDALDAVAAQFLEWHGAPTPNVTPAT
jgi:hypothetical protein